MLRGGREPVRNAGRLAAEAGESADEAGEATHQKKHLQPSAVPGEAVFHALAKTMGFDVAEAELDLHACAYRFTSCRAQGTSSSGEATISHGSRSGADASCSRSIAMSAR